jgi:hypothetical protein
MIDNTVLHYKILEKLGETRPVCADASAGRLLQTCVRVILEAAHD